MQPSTTTCTFFKEANKNVFDSLSTSCTAGLFQVAIVYTYELRPYLDLLLAILMMEDSWQPIRIQKTLKGIPEDHSVREGLFDIISRSQSHYQKRAYQARFFFVTRFSSFEPGSLCQTDFFFTLASTNIGWFVKTRGKEWVRV